MDAAGHGSAGVVVEDVDVHPVSAPVEEFNAHARGFDHLLLLDVSPLDLADFFLALLYRNRRGRNGSHLHVGRARLRILGFSPAGEIIVDEIIGRSLGQGMHIGRRSPVHLHTQVKGFFRVFGIGEHQARFALPLAHEGMFVRMGNSEPCDDESGAGRTGRNNLKRFDLAVRVRVPPGPEEVSLGIVSRNFRLTPAHVGPMPLVTPHQQLTVVRERDERLSTQRYVGNFEPFADGNADLIASLYAEYVIRDGDPQRSAFHQVGFQQAMGNNQSRCGTVDGDSHTARSPI